MKKIALVSVFDKTGIVEFVSFLLSQGFTIVSTGNTYRCLIAEIPTEERDTNGIISVEEFTGCKEMLGGRVKTLNHKIHGGILADRSSPSHILDMTVAGYPMIDLVIVNLYPFANVVAGGHPHDKIIDNIDIGGVTLVRSAAKNYKHVLVATNPSHYTTIRREFKTIWLDTPRAIEMRRKYATQAFRHVTEYDAEILKYFSDGHTITQMYDYVVPLKYGCNPHQDNSAVYTVVNGNANKPPFEIINGSPGYINILDAIYSWQLVDDLHKVTGMVSAASFKHTSPAGAAVALPLTEQLYAVYDVENYRRELTPAATAFIRARNADPLSSFGDFIAISGTVDGVAAQLIRREVSDGIIALDYTAEALGILRQKKSGKYIILKARNDLKDYLQCSKMDFRSFGKMAITQRPNKAIVNLGNNDTIPTSSKTLTEDAIRDLTIANIAIKYAQSNSVAIAYNGQIIGLGAGQQNRVDCVKIAKSKAETWLLRSHPLATYAQKQFATGVRRQDKINAMVAYVNGEKYPPGIFIENLCAMSDECKKIFVRMSAGKFSLASDAFFPFRDSIDAANEINVKYIIQPGGSVADNSVIAACDEYSITMVFGGVRSFTH